MLISRYIHVIIIVSIFFSISGQNIEQNSEVPMSANTSIKTVVCSDDSYASESDPDDNNGYDNSFKVGYDGGYYDEAFFFFEFPSTIVLEDIVSIELVFPIFHASADLDVNVYSTSGSWDENSITWNDKPSTSSFLGSMSISESSSSLTTLYYLDLPIGNESISICVKGAGSGGYALGDCKDGMSTGARIKIEYDDPQEEDDSSTGDESEDDETGGTTEYVKDGWVRVGPFSPHEEYINVASGHTYEFTIEVSSVSDNMIRFYLMNLNGDLLYFHEITKLEETIEFTAEETRTLEMCVFVDLYRGKTVDVKVEFTDKTEEFLLALLVIIGGSILGVAMVTALHFRDKKIKRPPRREDPSQLTMRQEIDARFAREEQQKKEEEDEQEETTVEPQEKIPSRLGFCPYCGHELKHKNASFCPGCGNEMEK